MAQATAICTCKYCGREFIKIRDCRDREDADEWEAWAVNHINVCNECNKISFVSYDGKYPNLCGGTLILNVAGEEKELHNVLVSSGYIPFDEDWVPYIPTGPWIVYCLPEWAKPFHDEIEAIVNEHVPFGCCGGCH